MKLGKQFLLALGQVYWRLYHYPTQQIAGHAPADRGHTLIAQAEQLAGLGFRRNLELDASVQGRYFQLPSQRSIDEADGNLAMQIDPFTLKNPVLAHRDLNVKIAGWTTMRPCLAFSAQTDAVAGINAWRHLDRQRLLLFHTATAVTGATRVLYLFTGTLTARTSLLNREKSLLHS